MPTRPFEHAATGAAKWYRGSTAAVLLATIWSAAAYAEPWTLDRVLVAARGEPGVAAAKSAGDAGGAGAAAGRLGFLPRIGLVAGWSRSDDPAFLFSETLRQGRFTSADFALSSLNQPPPRNTWSWGVAVDQPLWNGGAEVTAPALAAHRTRAARAASRAGVADRLLGAARAFVEAARARGAQAADSVGLSAAEEGRRAAVERFHLGQVPELDTLRAASRRAGARVDWLGSRKNLAVALARLEAFVGAPVPPDSLAPLPSPESLRSLSRGPAGAASVRRGEYEAAREEARARGIEATRASLAFLPAVNARAEVRRYEDPESGAGDRRFLVAVWAELPVWDGLRRWNDRRAARARADEAAARAELVRLELETASIDASAEAALALERRDSARLAAASSEEALRLAQARYRAGLLAQTDLLAVDAEAARARLFLVDSESEAVLAQVRERHARGLLE
jgi:outer membrane protein TolC